jgi:hypothetical protein
MLDPRHILYQDRSESVYFKREGLHYIGPREASLVSPTDAQALTSIPSQNPSSKNPKNPPNAP